MLVLADWEDVVPAARAAVVQADAAVIDYAVAGDRAVIRILTAKDVEGTLQADRLEPGSANPARIRLVARVGSVFRDHGAERRLVEAWRERLEQLAGAKWYPLKGYR